MRQLEEELITYGIAVPEMASKDDQGMLLDLKTAYLPEGADNEGSNPLPDSSAVAQNLASPAGSVLPVDLNFQNLESTGANPSTFGAASPGIPNGDNTMNQAQNFPDDMTYFEPMMDADWIWNISTLPSLPISDGLNFGLQEFSGIAGLLPDVPSTGVQMQTPHSLEEAVSSDDEDSPEVTQQLSDRLGTLLTMSDGETRYYGATSNLHLFHNRQKYGTSHALITRRKEASEILEARGLGHRIDPQVIDHLLQLYFTWHNNVTQVVDRHAFVAGRESLQHGAKTSIFFSELLLNAM